MAQKDDRKRLGKKHRQASTRPKKGRAPKSTPTTGAVDPRKRKVISTAAAKKAAAKRISRRSPEFESKKTVAQGDGAAGAGKKQILRSAKDDKIHMDVHQVDGVIRDCETERVWP